MVILAKIELVKLVFISMRLLNALSKDDLSGVIHCRRGNAYRTFRAMSYRAMPYIVDSFANQPSSRSRGTTAVERLRRARKSLNSYNVKRQRIGEEAECSCTNSRARFQLNPDDVSRTLGAKLPPARSSEATAAAALRTHDDVCSALPAAGYTDRVFEALHAVSGAEGSLDGRLTDVRRKNLSCCR